MPLPPRNKAIHDVYGVLLVRQEPALLEGMVVDLIAPDRQARFQAKLLQMFDAVQLQRALIMLGGADLDDLIGGQTNLLRQVVEHHLSAERRGQGGDEQAVIAARARSGDRAGGVAAQAVGNQPFTLDQAAVSGLLALRPGHAADELIEVNGFHHETIPLSPPWLQAPPPTRPGCANHPRSRRAACHARRSSGPRSTRAFSTGDSWAEPAEVPGRAAG